MLSVAATTLLNPNSLGELADSALGSHSADQERIAKVATDFESLFTSQLLKEMRKTLDPETMFGGDSGDVYGGLFDMFLGQQMAQGGGFGLAKMLNETLNKELKTPKAAGAGS